MWKQQQAQNAFEVTIRPGKIVGFLDNISAELTSHVTDSIYFNKATHASVAINIRTLTQEATDSQRQQLSNDIKDFAARVTKHQYWDNTDIPTGYQIMPQVQRFRVHVVWFIPRQVERSNVSSFLQVNLTIYPKKMSGLLYVTHVTHNPQVLFKDETYRVIPMQNIAWFATTLLELHKSDYMFMYIDRPDESKKDITILKFTIPQARVTDTTSDGTSDAMWRRVESEQTCHIKKTISEFGNRTSSDMKMLPPEKSWFQINYVYKFDSKSNKRMCLTIKVQDGPYTITLEQLHI
jgi:hypothetical protein